MGSGKQKVEPSASQPRWPAAGPRYSTMYLKEGLVEKCSWANSPGCPGYLALSAVLCTKRKAARTARVPLTGARLPGTRDGVPTPTPKGLSAAKRTPALALVPAHANGNPFQRLA